jgi:hypothetical protein
VATVSLGKVFIIVLDFPMLKSKPCGECEGRQKARRYTLTLNHVLTMDALLHVRMPSLPLVSIGLWWEWLIRTRWCGGKGFVVSVVLALR